MNNAISYNSAPVPILAFHKISTPRQKIRLPDDFVPSSFDVICGRGKQRHNHTGNKRFRATIAANVEQYQQADSKLDKTLVVLSIVEQVRQGPPSSGFVKQDELTGEWYEIGDQLAREKVGHALRDAIGAQKRGENKKKAKKKKKLAREKRATRILPPPPPKEHVLVLDENLASFLSDTFLDTSAEEILGGSHDYTDLLTGGQEGQEPRLQPIPLQNAVESPPIGYCAHHAFGEKKFFEPV